MLHRLHGARAAQWLRSIRQNRPGLGDRIYPTFIVCRGTERRAVIKPGAQIPLAVPGLALDRGANIFPVCEPAFGPRRISITRQRSEYRDRPYRKPREPHALALAGAANPVHAVVPVAGPDQRQAAGAGQGETLVETARAVLKERRFIFCCLGLVKCVLLMGADRAPIQERQHLVEHPRVARRLDVLANTIGEPNPVVGYFCAHALARGWEPPMLDVALDKLPRRGAQQMIANQLRSGECQRHVILQLIAEPIGAARLIKCRARSNPTRQRLVEQPTVQHDVHRAIRRANLHRADNLIPVALGLRHHLSDTCGTHSLDQRAYLLDIIAFADERYDLGPSARRDFDDALQRSARVKAAAGAS